MSTRKLSPVVRIALMIGAAALMVCLIVPLWRIDLDAPQYPEGLKLYIFSNKIGGNVDIVNGLNHYIGMKTLHTEDFIEFTFLPYLIGFFVLLFLITALVASRKMLIALLIAFICFGVIAIIDFWRWEYNYGHNLNPDAAIQVPGMSYQPPLIGFKQLLNFGAYSIPATGGWLFILAGVLLLFSVYYSRAKKTKIALSNQFVAAACLLTLTMQGCNTGPQPISRGKDNCKFCTMTITDMRYCSEILTRKGKVYKFDDYYCLNSFLQSNEISRVEIEEIYFTTFTGDHHFIKAPDAVFFHSDSLATPMNGHIAAFTKGEAIQQIMTGYNGKILEWKDINK